MVEQTERAIEPKGARTTPGGRKPRRLASGLSTKLLLLTVLFVMLSEVLIYVPSLANFRNTYLADRLERASIALSVADAAGDFDMLSKADAELILDELQVQAISLQEDGKRQMIAMRDLPEMISSEFVVGAMSPGGAILEALRSLVNGNERTTRVVSATPDANGREVDIVLRENALRAAMINHSINILQLSLMISFFTAVLVFISLRALFVRPFRKVTKNMLEFSADPENEVRIIAQTDRDDELGVAQQQLREMQKQLQTMLAEKRTLADLGLAVSKINHDLRNILASAVLVSDRLHTIDDPAVQRFTPKLVRALNRAIDYCQSTLAYGSAQEAAPAKRMVQLSALIQEVDDVLGLSGHDNLEFVADVDPELSLSADPDQLFRVLMNLSRNALQAMNIDDASSEGSVRNALTISAEQSDVSTTIHVADNGPGIPETMRERLFQAFQTDSTPGQRKGTGLGLAIAAELVRAHGGELVLKDVPQGACFCINLPRRTEEARRLEALSGNADEKPQLRLVQPGA